MHYAKATTFLKKLQQEHLLKYWEKLTPAEQAGLLKQISLIDFALFQEQQELIRHPPTPTTGKIEPFLDFFHSGTPSDKELGHRLLAEGKMGSLIVAGGQGSRLRFEHPKGMFPVSLIKKKSLFQLFAEKTMAASKQVGQLLPLAVMTSPLNHAETVKFFKEHSLFGLDQEQLFFFSQGMLPLLNEQGNLFLETPSLISEGPDGNGGALWHFVKSGLWSQWSNRGIQYLNFIQVDNILADPFDKELLGFHFRHQNQITLKCTERKDEEEKVASVVKTDGKLDIIEYSEMPDLERCSKNKEGSLKHRCANLSLFCFSMDFVKEATSPSAYQRMPWHLAHKGVKCLDREGVTQTATKPNSWKFEKFIFDLVSFSKKVGILLFPREECFAPLKNFEGNHSLATVHDFLLKKERKIFSEITGKKPPTTSFELAQAFYYPTPELEKKWKGRAYPDQSYLSDV